MTVLFADLVDSTALGESIDPERLRVLLGTYFAAMSTVIETWGGTVQKYIGDAIMATFGVPVAREDDAERALRAALEMLGRLATLNDEFERRHGVRLAVRIGANTGEVMVPVGGPVAELIVAGDAVNTAARIEQSAEPGTALVGPRTHDAARNAMRFGEPVDLVLKGKAAPVRAWPLLGGRLETERGIPGLHAPMVGRDRELESLVALLDEAVERRQPRLAIVFGPAGMGKSRLVAEFITRARAGDAPALVLRGRCLAIGQSATYWALAEILRSIAGLGLDEAPEAATERLTAAVEPRLAALGLDAEERAFTLDALALTAGLMAPGSSAGDDPERTGAALGLAWPRLVSALALDAPVVIVIEDLHWAATPVLEILTSVITRSQGAIVVVGTARPEFAAAHPGFLEAREDSAQVTLRPLSEAQTGALVEALLDVADLPATLRQQLADRAEGNPFFLEELIRRLIDEGAIVADGDGWRATDQAVKVRLPDSIHGLLASRIDGLDPASKTALQEAAVVGRVFWLAPIEPALPDGEIAAAVRVLEARGFVTARPHSSIGGAMEYQFRHALIRDVAYGSIPKARRARSHAAVADWLERFAGERRDSLIEIMAEHYRAAVADEDADLAWADAPETREEVRARAVATLIEAGDIARRGFALERAAELHGAALGLAAVDSERSLAEEALGDDHYEAFRADLGNPMYRRALERAAADGRGPDQARLAMKIARAIAWRPNMLPRPLPLDEADALVDDGLAAAPEPTVRCWLLIVAASLQGNWASGGGVDPRPIEFRQAAGIEAASLADSLGDLELARWAARTLRDLAEATDDWDRIVEYGRRALDLGMQSDDPRDRQGATIDAVFRIGELEGRFGEAHRRMTEAAGIAPDSRHSRLHVTAALIWTGHRVGAWRDLEPIMDEHLREAEKDGPPVCPLVRLGILLSGIVSAHQAKVEAAQDALRRVEPAFGTDFSPIGQPMELVAALGDPERAREMGIEVLNSLKTPWSDDVLPRLLDTLVALGDWATLPRIVGLARQRQRGLAVLGPTVDRATGAMQAALGDRAAGVALLERALAAFERLELPFEVARTGRWLAAALPDDPSRAAALLARVSEIDADLGIPSREPSPTKK